jgi:hypothetical protein
MSEIRPFAALRFARDPEPRLAPPWDVISEEDRARLAREPESVVHLTLPPGVEGERDYAGAGDTLRRWLREGVLVRDPLPRLYLLRERISDGRVRRGLFASSPCFASPTTPSESCCRTSAPCRPQGATGCC